MSESVEPPQLIFVLAGQSNMAGRGAIEMALPPSSKILMLSGENGKGQWKVAEEPTHADVDTERLRVLAGSPSKKECGVGPALFFAEHLMSLIKQEVSQFDTDPTSKRSPSLRIGLVPTAIGGTSIDAWQAEPAPLFKHMLAQISRALALATSPSSNPTNTPAANITAILWHQGESDADTHERSEAYGAKLASFLCAARASTSMQAHRVPVVLCGIWGAQWRVPFMHNVRAAQLAACDVSRRDDERADGYVETKDLEFQDDGLHLTADAARQLGVRLAEAVWRVPQVRREVERLSSYV